MEVLSDELVLSVEATAPDVGRISVVLVGISMLDSISVEVALNNSSVVLILAENVKVPVIDVTIVSVVSKDGFMLASSVAEGLSSELVVSPVVATILAERIVVVGAVEINPSVTLAETSSENVERLMVDVTIVSVVSKDASVRVGSVAGALSDEITMSVERVALGKATVAMTSIGPVELVVNKLFVVSML